MSAFIKQFKFEKSPLKITYFDKEPLNLSNEFIFFHNKSKFRKELTRLQYLIKSYTKTPLIASGIRDAFLKEEYSEKYLIVLFTTSEISKKTNEIIEPHSHLELKSGCYLIESTSEHILLLAKDLNGIKSAIITMEDIFYQTFEEYFTQENVDNYIKIRAFRLLDCGK